MIALVLLVIFQTGKNLTTYTKGCKSKHLHDSIENVNEMHYKCTGENKSSLKRSVTTQSCLIFLLKNKESLLPGFDFQEISYVIFPNI